MAHDDLNIPLGLDPTGGPSRLRQLAPRIVAATLAVVLASFGAWSLFGSDRQGGEPMVFVNAPNTTGDAGAGAKQTSAVMPGGVAEPLTGAETPGKAQTGEPGRILVQQGPRPAEPEADGPVVTIIDGRSGSRQQVRLPGPGPAPPVGASAQLLEMTRNGSVPRIGADGQRPAQVYAQPASANPTLPQIAIVVTGLGISAVATTEAINKLPAPITLAFTPYAPDLERLADKARGLGHELLLQVAMEPLDYPDNDPGPQTLLTSLTPEQNVDRLQWAMSRFQGYVGIVNQMGARFTASELSLTPILREIGRRGLIYVDDGSSLRSLASQIAGGSSLPFVRASLAVDAIPTASETDRALMHLEGIARESGSAVGFAAAIPVAIERISRWAMTVESRGFALVAISAATHNRTN